MQSPASRRQLATLIAFAISPLVIAVFAMLFRPWAPVFDMAMTEFRVRDVGGRFTPRIGLPGRIGNFPDQGSHPGPWSFYFVAPFYRIAGASAWGLQLGSVIINSVAVGAAVVIGWRVAGRQGAIAIAAVAAIAIRGFGLNVLSHPWNPYFPLLLWLVTLVAAWAVLLGHHRVAPAVAVGGSIAAQTHIPYLVPAVFVSVLVLGSLVRRWRESTGESRDAVARSTGWAIGVTVLLWLPPLADQARSEPGNLTMLYRHFTGDPSEPLIGAGTAIRVFLRHLDLVGAAGDLLTRSDGFVHRSSLPYGPGIDLSAVFGLATLCAWVVAVVVARRRRHRALTALNTVIAVTLAATATAVSRILGKVWFYLTLWAWVTLLLVTVSLAWTLLLVASERFGPARAGRVVAPAVLGTGGIATLLSLTAIAGHEVPEAQLSDGLRAVVPETAAAITDGVGASVGPDGRYLVFWRDAVLIGSQGYGLVNELERRGLNVGVHPAWRVPVTHHRVLTAGQYDAEVHLVTGGFIEQWRDRDDFVEVAQADVRSDDERARFAELRARVGQRLDELGRSELVEVVDTNLFGASLDPALPDDVIADLGEMLLIGEPVSVFLVPAGSSR